MRMQFYHFLKKYFDLRTWRTKKIALIMHTHHPRKYIERTNLVSSTLEVVESYGLIPHSRTSIIQRFCLMKLVISSILSVSEIAQYVRIT